MKIAVLDDYDGTIAKLACWGPLKESHEVDFFSSPVDSRVLGDHEVIVTVRERTVISKEFLTHTARLKHLALTGRLSGQADLQALEEKKVAVSYTDGSGSAASEMTIGLILGITKGIHLRHHLVQQGGWHLGAGSSLAGKTLGVLGLGRIGSKVAAFGKLMDMNVLSWGPTLDQGRSEKLGVRRLDLNECLKESEVLAICLRLSEKTKGLLGTSELALLRDGAYLVNTARAEIIEKSALYQELESGRIFAALDVFHEEPLPAQDPIRKFTNVLLSPHMGYVTQEVYQVFFPQVVENILAWECGKEFRRSV